MSLNWPREIDYSRFVGLLNKISTINDGHVTAGGQWVQSSGSVLLFKITQCVSIL